MLIYGIWEKLTIIFINLTNFNLNIISFFSLYIYIYICKLKNYYYL